MKTPLHLAAVSSTRADWGLLSPLLRELRARGHRVDVIATNMHLRSDCGMTVSEIEADGFMPIRVPSEGTQPQIAAAVMVGVAEELQRLDPDAVVMLGDRYEMVAAAQGAVMAGVPIVHIAGGAVSRGAYDDCFRHAITKLSYLHLTETEEYRRRVIQLGEEPERVVCTGAIGIHNILHTPLMSREELERSLGFELGDNTLLVTLHAATLSPMPPEKQLDALLRALDTVPDRRVLFTHPNNDVDPAPLIAMLHDYVRRHPQRAHVVASLGHSRYLSVLQYAEAVVGNSSSGLVEVPSMGIPTVDIGCRQDGRLHAESVVRCGESELQIAQALALALTPEHKTLAARRENPYARPDTLRLMADTIENTPMSHYPQKTFYDL